MHNIVWIILAPLLLLLPTVQASEGLEADLIFDRVEGDTWTVYAANLEQGITVPILTGDSRFGCPLVSPNSRYMAFNSRYHPLDDELQYAVYIFNSATQTTQTVGPFAFDSLRDGGISCDMVWSPNSEWLLFHSPHQDDEGWFDDYIVRADGSDLRQLTRGYSPKFFAWANDSQSAYITNNWAVHRVEIETMNMELVSDLVPWGHGQFSPDQTSLYIHVYPPEEPIMQVDVATGDSETLFEHSPNGMEWAWSPDGSIGAVSLGKEVYAVQDGEMWPVVYPIPGGIWDLMWLPDNRTLIMNYDASSSDDEEPWVVTVQVEQGVFDEMGFLRHGIMPMLSPDGEWIAFLRKHADGYEIYRMRPDGSTIAPIPEGVVDVGLWDRWPFTLRTPLAFPAGWQESDYEPAKAPTLPPRWTCPSAWDTDECYVLQIFYFYCEGQNWINATNWGTANEPWYGVRVNEDGHVTALELIQNNLHKTLVPYLGDLTYLEHLSLADNALRGSISSELGNLTTLRSLDLSNNRFSGTLPEWLDGDTEAGHPALEVLSVGNNCGLTAPNPTVEAFVESLDPGWQDKQDHCDR